MIRVAESEILGEVAFEPLLFLLGQVVLCGEHFEGCNELHVCLLLLLYFLESQKPVQVGLRLHGLRALLLGNARCCLAELRAC